MLTIHPNPSDGYVDLSPGGLRITVISSSVDPSCFTVYASRTITLAGFDVVASVIGASHVINVGAMGDELTEVLACTSVPGAAHVLLGDLLYVSRRIESDRLTYDLNVYRVPWCQGSLYEPPELVCLVAKVNNCGDQSDCFGMVQEFPCGVSGVVPKTVIFGYVDGDCLIIETAHSYPNVPALVMSRTIVLQKKGGTECSETLNGRGGLPWWRRLRSLLL